MTMTVLFLQRTNSYRPLSGIQKLWVNSQIGYNNTMISLSLLTWSKQNNSHLEYYSSCVNMLPIYDKKYIYVFIIMSDRQISKQINYIVIFYFIYNCLKYIFLLSYKYLYFFFKFINFKTRNSVSLVKKLIKFFRNSKLK